MTLVTDSDRHLHGVESHMVLFEAWIAQVSFQPALDQESAGMFTSQCADLCVFFCALKFIYHLLWLLSCSLLATGIQVM